MSDRLSPNWLAEEMQRIPADHAMSFDRNPALSHHTLLDDDGAARLRAKMIRRYQDWTGRDLAADLSPPHSKNEGDRDE